MTETHTSLEPSELPPPAWDQIETVLLDMDGTLLDLHFDSHFWLEHLPKRYAQLHKLDEASAKETVISAINGQRGTLNWYSLDYWAKCFELDIVELKREVQHLIGFRSDAKHLLEFLQQHNARIVLATNADQHSLKLKLPPTGLDQYVDDIVSSAQLGIAKEDPAFWQALQSEVAYNPATTLLIDDNEEVLDSAQAYGIQYLYTILQPDMRSPERTVTRYPGVKTFNQITR
ncbi:MAG: haloacid dehalogenase [Oceanospirillum sp.]|nr:haloacid dehalogenase [Oceanospirillum sp.]